MKMFKDVPLATRSEITPKLGFALVVLLALVWLIPFLWMMVATLRPPSDGINVMAAMLPSRSPTLDNIRDAWEIGDFPRYFLNTTIICTGILLVQFVTVTLAGFAFARLAFAGKMVLPAPSRRQRSGRRSLRASDPPKFQIAWLEQGLQRPVVSPTDSSAACLTLAPRRGGARYVICS
jgi:hypothetical protein